MGLRLPQLLARQFVGQILLGDIMAGIVMRIEVAVVITQVSHQFGGSVAQVQRHGLVAGAAHEVERTVDAEIGAVALLARGEINRSLGKGYAALGPSYLVDGVEGGIGKQQGVGIGKSDVLRSTNNESACDELWVLVFFNYVGKLV